MVGFGKYTRDVFLVFVAICYFSALEVFVC